jgi:cystathionine beta-lyase
MLALIDCYNNEENWLNQLNDYIDANFEYTQKYLKDNLDLTFIIPKATYLAWIDISPLQIPMKQLQSTLVNKEEVAIMDGRVYGNGGANYLRFNEGASRKKIIDGLERLNAAVRSFK